MDRGPIDRIQGWSLPSPQGPPPPAVHVASINTASAPLFGDKEEDNVFSILLDFPVCSKVETMSSSFKHHKAGNKTIPGPMKLQKLAVTDTPYHPHLAKLVLAIDSTCVMVCLLNCIAVWDETSSADDVSHL